LEKKPGKQCWSINCRKNLPIVLSPKKITCSHCNHVYCHHCIEIWADGWKACPQCTIDEVIERKSKGEKLPEVKKRAKGIDEEIKDDDDDEDEKEKGKEKDKVKEKRK